MRCLERLELQGLLPAEQGGCQRSGVAAAARARRRCELAAVLTIVQEAHGVSVRRVSNHNSWSCASAPSLV